MGTSVDPLQVGSESCRLRGAFFTPSIFNDFRDRGDFFDINLFTDEGTLPAHKVILSACSDFFREKLRRMQPSWTIGDPAFSGTVQSAPVMAAVYMAGVTHADLESILEFIYKGDVQMSLERLDDFLLTAQKLKVKGLITETDQMYRESLSGSSAGMRLSAALKEKRAVPKHFRAEKRVAKTPRPAPTRKSAKLERQIHEVGSDEIAVQHQVKVEPEVIKGTPDDDNIAEEDGEGTMEVVDTLEVVASNNEEVDVRFEIGDWRLEVGENDESNDPNEVLIDGQKVQSFIKKVNNVYQCQLCDHSSKDKSNLVRHLKRRHTTPTHELCPHCGKTYKNKECLYNHMSSKRCLRGAAFNPRDPRILNFLRFDTDDKKWSCIECGNKYRQKVYAREHVVFKHIGVERGPDEQEGTTVEDPTLSKFIEFVPSQNKWKCLSCGRQFITSFNVSNHIKQKHLVGGEVGIDVEEEEEDEGAHLQPESETDDESGDD